MVVRKFQDYLIETFKNYNPDFPVFWSYEKYTTCIHIDLNLELLNKNLNHIHSGMKILVMPSLDYSRELILKNISYYADFVDHNFITTDPTIFRKQNPVI